MDKKKQQDGKEQSKMIGVVPDGWEVIGLLNVCDLINGRAFKPNEWSEDGLPIVRIENLNNNDACFNYCNFKVPCKYLLQQNDLLISWSGTPGTSFGIFNWNRGKAILNQHIFKVILKEGVEKKYFYYAYKRLLVEMIRQSHGGVGLQHITKEDLKRFEFLLPSLSDRYRLHFFHSR
ncbi:MAG: restriction endonuclease subunit S [Candidatus Brocadiae bacterium]|nr:restriction endonuclease subunit S [Candidatus Brocadiia bacterium]